MSLALAKWIGTVSGIIGAFLVAMHIPQSGYGFLFFTVSAITWGLAGWIQRDWALLTLQSVFLGINLLGVYRWLLT